ncbi:hypothetical protein HanIR_Chr17g0897321 [Helianthus annuus]|nr:hypothetical protein HanIR_Chr17g0897321 [Helianthus annuus]
MKKMTLMRHVKEDELGNGLHTIRRVVRALKAVKRVAYLVMSPSERNQGGSSKVTEALMTGMM